MSRSVSLLARALTRSGALKFGAFTLRSGAASPYYVDLSWLLSSPEGFRCVVDAVAEEMEGVLATRRVDRLATVELKGALLLPSVANRLAMPCVVVRKEQKRYGVTGRIAGGEVERGERILFFDDVVTDAGSKLEGMRPLERLGARVETVLVVVDREQGGRERLQKLGYGFQALTTITVLTDELLRSRCVSEEQAEAVLTYVEETTPRSGERNP